MSFWVDAQLPPRRAALTVSHDAIHAQSLVGGSRMPDAEISAVADDEGRIVVSKAVTRTPCQGRLRSCCFVVTGHLSNDDLVALFDDRIDEVGNRVSAAPTSWSFIGTC